MIKMPDKYSELIGATIQSTEQEKNERYLCVFATTRSGKKIRFYLVNGFTTEVERK